jgi:hypothetical protein
MSLCECCEKYCVGKTVKFCEGCDELFFQGEWVGKQVIIEFNFKANEKQMVVA